MSFTIFTNGSLANADEVMANFYHIAQGNRFPRGSANLIETTGAYDIGSTTYPWSAAYCDQIDYSGTFTTNKMWIFVSELTLSSTSSRVEFSGLNGDIDDIYKIVINRLYSPSNILLNINGNSSAAYKTRGISYEKLKDIDISAVTTSFLLHHDIYVSGNIVESEILIFCDSGYNKVFLNDYHMGAIAATLDGVDFGQDVGTANITGTLTSIQITIPVTMGASLTARIRLYRAKNV